MTDDLFPREARRSLPIALLRAREAIMQHFRPMLASHDLSEQQWRVLRILSERGVMDATALAEQSFVLMPSLSRILDALEKRALVRRLRDSGDKRRIQVSLTGAGEAIIAAVLPDSRAIYRAIEAKFGRRKIDALLDLLDEFSGT